MARFTAYYSVQFDVNKVNFNWYIRNYVDSDFLDNSFKTYHGFTYQDWAYVIGDDGAGQTALGVAGSGFVLDPVTSKFTAGTLNFLSEASVDLDQDLWILDKFSIPLAVFDNALTSRGTTDDLDFMSLVFEGNDTFNLSPYDDSAPGYDGNDKMFGNGGDDILAGGNGDDKLDGGIGDDFLGGGMGQDVYTGGIGRDTYYFKDPSETAVGRTRDRIMDFSNTYDVLDLHSIDADVFKAGNQKFHFIGADQFDVGGVAQLRYANGVLAGDVDRDGIADFEISFANRVALDPDSIIP